MKSIFFNIEQNCGDNVNNIEYSDPGNDPNFIFENDPLFETLTLYSQDGNVINVNSWFECVHYVNGGWSSTQINNILGEMYLSFSLLALSTFLTIFIIYSNKRKNKNG
jgi:hypothetical protein|tara:strand:+ start:32 stop:355 length:324 start_codon:yes stop_codon:yes gene_type:complete